MNKEKEMLSAIHSTWYFAEKLNTLEDIQVLSGRQKQKINNLISTIDILEKKVSEPFNFDGNLADRVLITHDIFDAVCTFLDTSNVEQLTKLLSILGLEGKYGVQEKP